MSVARGAEIERRLLAATEGVRTRAEKLALRLSDVGVLGRGLALMVEEAVGRARFDVAPCLPLGRCIRRRSLLSVVVVDRQVRSAATHGSESPRGRAGSPRL